MNLSKKKLALVNSLCKDYNVEKLYLFGSVVEARSNKKSDIDFLVRFKQIDLARYFENYLEFKENLRKVFKREIDLVEEQTLKNPILIKSINKNKKLIYG